jgi:hypothetical protein
MNYGKHKKEIAGFIKNGDFEKTDGGILIHNAIMARGMYTHSVNGGDEETDKNLIPDEGIAHILGVALSDDVRVATWYLAVFSGAVTPAANWTAANFTANSSEITSNTEGYSDTTRREWVPGVVTGGVLDNLASKAVFNIACTTTINISGVGMLSSNTKGGTTGTLVSATRFSAARTLNDTDAFELGYEMEIQDT